MNRRSSDNIGPRWQAVLATLERTRGAAATATLSSARTTLDKGVTGTIRGGGGRDRGRRGDGPADHATAAARRTAHAVRHTGLDGAPRVIPLAYLWDGTSLLFWTNTISAKVRALQADPRVAVTIDVIGPPPRVLLARGTAELTTVDGVPDGYLQASHRTTPPEAWDDFDTQVHGLYTQMVAVRITPTWAKLLDFETTAPSAVEQLVRERSQ